MSKRILSSADAEKLRKAQVAAIAKRLQQGKPITAAQQKLLDEETETDTRQLSSKQVHAKLIANIKSKVRRGETLEPSESKILQAHLSTEIAEAAGAEWVENYQRLGEILGCHADSFRRWRRDYEDCPKPRADNHHNVLAWRNWFRAHPEIRSSRDISTERALIELKTMEQQLRRITHKADVEAKSVTRNEVFAAEICRVVGMAKTILRQKFEFELPPFSAHQDAAQIRVLNKRAIDDACARLSELEMMKGEAK